MVEPYVDRLVALDHRPGAQPAGPVRAVLVGDGHVVPVRGPDPPVERALDAVVDDAPAVRQASAEVPAVPVVYPDNAVLAAVGDQVAAEVAQRYDLFLSDVARPCHLEPAGQLKVKAMQLHRFTLPVALRGTCRENSGLVSATLMGMAFPNKFPAAWECHS